MFSLRRDAFGRLVIGSIGEVLGGATLLSGFYSYGEISPFNPDAKCELHNQTMTITTFWEN